MASKAKGTILDRRQTLRGIVGTAGLTAAPAVNCPEKPNDGMRRCVMFTPAIAVATEVARSASPGEALFVSPQ
jgi:hypothetical protein